MEKIEVIGVRIPHPGVIRGPEVRWFGRHYGSLEEIPDIGINYALSPGLCNGRMELQSSDKKPLQNLSGLEPIIAECPNCGFFIALGNNWLEAAYEWMRIALGTVIWESRFTRDPNYPHEDSPLRFFDSIIWNNLTICFPEELSGIDSVIPYLQENVGDGICWWTQADPPNRPRWFPILPYWKDHNIAVARALEWENLQNLQFLVLDAALLMQQLEKTFQKAIKRAAQLSSSASEPFHPSTRWPRV